MLKYNHTKEDYEEAVKGSKSIADVCRYLGIVSAGGNYQTINKKIQEYDLDTEHFTNKPTVTLMYSASPGSKKAIKSKLIRDRGHRCEKCLNEEWLKEPITLELEHIDGDNSNDNLDNLLLLCPNCHSLTKTWRRPKSSFKTKKDAICACGNPKKTSSKTCFTCFRNRYQLTI